MPTFEYQAQGADGQVIRGQEFGASIDQVLSTLSSRGMKVVNIGVAQNLQDPLAGMNFGAAPAAVAPVAAVQERPHTGYEATVPSVESNAPVYLGPSTDERSYMQTAIWGPLVGQVPLPALQFFFRQGATMFEAGVPAVQALETLSGQSASGKLGGIIREIAEHVKAGRSISVGLQRYPEVFSPIIVSLIRAGEEGGFLASSMTVVADYLEKEIELRNLYKRVTFWPKLQVGISIVIIVGANLIIDSLGGKEKLYSPLTNPVTWVWLGPLIVAAFLFFRVGLANPRIKYNWDLLILKVPYIGKTVQQVTMAKFGRAFGALYKGGVPLQKALTLSADSCGNEMLRERMYRAYRGLEGGAGITETLRSTNAFSPIVLDMVGTGEQTGNLDQMLNRVAEFYEDEAATRSVKTGQVVGALLTLLVAIYIGYIVINFWMNHYAGISSAAS